MKVSYNLKATYREVRSCFYMLSQIVSQMLIVHDRFFLLKILPLLRIYLELPLPLFLVLDLA